MVRNEWKYSLWHEFRLPKGEGGPKGRMRRTKTKDNEENFVVPLTRRFAAPSLLGRGIGAKHFPYCVN